MKNVTLARRLCSGFLNKPRIHLSRWRTLCTFTTIPCGNYIHTHINTATYVVHLRKAKDLSQLSSLGHFLKGSSATLGLTKVKDSCEKIQHFGIKKDEDGTHDIPDESACLEKIKKTLDVMKEDYRQAEKYLLKFYDDAP